MSTGESESRRPSDTGEEKGSVDRHAEAVAGRVRIVDVLRGFLAWSVVAWHLFWGAGFPLEELATKHWFFRRWTGEDAVLCFFVISGFALTCSILRDGPRFSIRKYALRRFFRIYPLYWIALAISIVFWLRIERVHIDRFGWHLAAHIPMLHGVVPNSILPDGLFSLLGAAWSLSTEEQFYVLIPWLILPLVFARWRRHFTVLAIASLLIFAVDMAPFPLSRGLVLVHLRLFLIGASSAIALERSLPGWVRGFHAALSIAPLVLFGWTTAPLWVWYVVYGLMALSRTELRPYASRVIRLFENRFFLFLGQGSYSTYLLHSSVLGTIRRILIDSGHVSGGGASLPIFALIGIPAVLAATALGWYGVERPLIEWSKRKTR